MSELRFKYVRIQGKELAENTLHAKGIFSMCMKMVQEKIMDQEDADLFMEINDWFAEHLPWPLDAAEFLAVFLRLQTTALTHPHPPNSMTE